MKKYLIWIPVIGFFYIIFFKETMGESLLFRTPINFVSSALVQGISLALLFYFLTHN